MIHSETTPAQISLPGARALIDMDDLRKLVSGADPAALLVPPWLMRRIIKADRGISGLVLEVPHRKTYCLSTNALLAITSREELGVSETHVLPDRLLLLSCSPAALADHGRPQALLHFWRLLFHASIDQALIEKGCACWVGRTPGAVEMDEAANVLRSDNYLLPPVDEASSFAEFVAVYLELRFFEPALLACTFPSIETTTVDALVGQLVDASAIFSRTRLAGAAEPTIAHSAVPAQLPSPATAVRLPADANNPQRASLPASADAARQQGNLVRSAILRTQASGLGQTFRA